MELFYHTWKTISSSPFANAIVFVESDATITPFESITAEIVDKSITGEAITLTIQAEHDGATLQPNDVNFVQTEVLTTNGIAVHKYGALLIPAGKASTNIKLVAVIDGVTYEATTNITSASNVGATVTMNKQ